MEGLRLYHIDEGYSEHPMVQDEDEDETIMTGGDSIPTASLLAFENHIVGLDEDTKADHICRILESLPTSAIARIVDRLTPRLHLDPVARLPPEIIAQIFSYLSPEMLMLASTVSRAWRAETLETSLWRRKFVSEGWYLNISKVLKFEREHGRASARKPLSRRAASDADPRETKRRAVSPSNLLFDVALASDPAMSGNVQTGVVEELASPTDLHSSTSDRLNTAYSTMSDDLHDLRLPSYSRSLMIKMPSGDSRLDYQKLYKIKSQLEDNWMQGRYRHFQFPHPDHPHEAHTECVYTIQFSDKYLVSGSRDRTIRVWDLETFRLVKKPLYGHTGSVLSLQFDESADEDIIVSGSSDKCIGVWQFSTGRLLNKITDMHTEAVLCVRFDKRYMASCSKDKLIKIFNRRPLKPDDADYPIRGVVGGGTFPDYVVDISQLHTVQDFERYLTPEQKRPLEPYTLIMTLEHHNGAVNSLHIHDDKLASGSGDRTAKIFDLRTGEVRTNCRAHNKGVACIEYDGARLVTGSSDEMIRIFDPATNAEVGRMEGHKKLVRTIQTDFADAPGARETLEEDAMLADQALLDSQGEDVSASFRNEKTYTRGVHGSRPRRQNRAPPPLHNAIGAKLPPGGGGNRWSRIVSGSYDEIVLVWRQEADRRWVVCQRYRVADALRQAGPLLYAASDPAIQQQRIRRAARGPLPVPSVTYQNNGATTAPGYQADTFDVNNSIAGPNAANAAASLAAAAHHGIGSMPLGRFHLQNDNGHGQLSTNPFLSVSRLDNRLTHNDGGTPAPSISQVASVVPNMTVPNGLGNPQPAAAAAAAAATAAVAMHTASGSARAFKLQFDARRIICCSQDPKIVGWDFAAGNKEIIEAARFFTRTSHYARGG